MEVGTVPKMTVPANFENSRMLWVNVKATSITTRTCRNGTVVAIRTGGDSQTFGPNLWQAMGEDT